MISGKESELDLQTINEEKLASIENGEKFLRQLYNSAVDWVQNRRKGQKLAEFGPQYVSDWVRGTSPPFGHPSLSVDLEKAVLFKTHNRYFAFALGSGVRSQYQREKTLGFQFGTFPVGKKFDKDFADKNIELTSFRILFFQSPLTYGSGELYIEDMLAYKVRLDCWADHWQFGGKMIREWTQEKLLSEKGIKACLEIIGRTSRNGFMTR